MKTLLVTSEVTFVPKNYDQVVLGLASNKHITALLVLNNGDFKLALKALRLIAVGAFSIGGHLLRNQFGRSRQRRERAYSAVGKPVFYADSVNTTKVLAIIRSLDIDLVLNARTRCIYQDAILSAPRLGCINIHHGLLPEQRGTMCDLWSIAERKPTGFSIHRMTSKIDQGEIVITVQTSDGKETRYAEYLARTAKKECVMLQSVLAGIADQDDIVGRASVPLTSVIYRRDPLWSQLQDFKRVVKI